MFFFHRDHGHSNRIREMYSRQRGSDSSQKPSAFSGSKGTALNTDFPSSEFELTPHCSNMSITSSFVFFTICVWYVIPYSFKKSLVSSQKRSCCSMYLSSFA